MEPSIFFSSNNNNNNSKNNNNTSELKKQQHRFVQDRSKTVKVSENGVIFRSYRNGEKILLTPESSIQAQKSLGADIIIPLDELPPYHIDRNVLSNSVDRVSKFYFLHGMIIEKKSVTNNLIIYLYCFVFRHTVGRLEV